MVPDEPELSVLDHLDHARRGFARVGIELMSTTVHIERALEAAKRQDRPTVQLSHLLGEVETLQKIITETVVDMIRKAAEVEAGSRG